VDNWKADRDAIFAKPEFHRKSRQFLKAPAIVKALCKVNVDKPSTRDRIFTVDNA